MNPPIHNYLMSDVMRAELIDGDISTESRAWQVRDIISARSGRRL